jgi:hypothetical protein
VPDDLHGVQAEHVEQLVVEQHELPDAGQVGEHCVTTRAGPGAAGVLHGVHGVLRG